MKIFLLGLGLAAAVLPVVAAEPQLQLIELVAEADTSRRSFVEVIRPVPAFVAREQALRQTLEKGSYDDDRIAEHRPAIFIPPQVLALTREDFLSDDEQMKAGGTFLEFEIRRRRRTEYFKKWSVPERQFFNMVGRFVPRERKLEIFRAWERDTQFPIATATSVTVTVEELDGERGAFFKFDFMTDKKGRFRLPLAVFLNRLLRETEKGLTLQIEVPGEKTRLTCTIDREELQRHVAELKVRIASSAP